MFQNFLWKTIWLTNDTSSLCIDLLAFVLSVFIFLIPYFIMKISLFLANKYPDTLYLKLFFYNKIFLIILLIVCMFIDIKYILPNVIPFTTITEMAFFTGNLVSLLWARIEYKYFNRNYFSNKPLLLKLIFEISKIIFLDILTWLTTILFLLSISLYYSIFH